MHPSRLPCEWVLKPKAYFSGVPLSKKSSQLPLMLWQDFLELTAHAGWSRTVNGCGPYDTDLYGYDLKIPG